MRLTRHFILGLALLVFSGCGGSDSGGDKDELVRLCSRTIKRLVENPASASILGVDKDERNVYLSISSRDNSGALTRREIQCRFDKAGEISAVAINGRQLDAKLVKELTSG